ncbi:MAG: response regulator [Actinomycetota bacterium]|nr:response regulator [Actinomycetota bacterium]
MTTPRNDLILVIDDDAQVLRLLEASLAAQAYRVVTASNGSDGIASARLHKPSLILLDLVMPVLDGFGTCRKLNQDVSLKHIPVIAMTGHEIPTDRLGDILGCIDDYLAKPFDQADLLARVELSLRRARSFGGANPLTRLPGNVAIQEELMDRIAREMQFALLYIDIDGFKAFNDHYGFLRGDEAIKLLARCAREAVTEYSPMTGFIGHIGGDDFAAIVEPEAAQQVAEQILRTWEELLPTLYEPEDADRGFIEVADRRGQLTRYALASVSIGIVTNAIRPLQTHWEAAEIATEMKHVAKTRHGSSIAIDRRRQISLEDQTPAGVR